MIMETIFEFLPFLEDFGPGVLVPVIGFAVVGILAQWSLYDKCGLPGIDCIIPVKNVITFLKIMGRPAAHSLYVMIPPVLILFSIYFLGTDMIGLAVAGTIGALWALFMAKIYIELCQCFGHYKLTDYVLVTLFNGFYVLHLGLSYSEKYRGPVYGKSKESVEGQMA